MLHTTRRWTRSVASLAATTIAATSLATIAGANTGSAHAAEPVAPALTWEISQQFDDHLSTHELTDGATEAEDGAITFPHGVGTFDPQTGAASVAYQGSVSGSFVVLGTTYYTVTLTDPILTVDPAGAGAISAVVSASNAAAGPGAPAAATTPARVTVTTFTTPDAWALAEGLGSITATPAWAGVLPADSAAGTDLGIGAGKPVNGQAFDPEFLAQITPGVRAHFYASGSGSDAKKAPSTFTAQATETPKDVQVETTSASYATGLSLAVNGSGFSAATNPGDMGIYVGLAPSGGLPDVSSQDDMDAFAASAWVMPQQMLDGTFDVSLTAATEDLDPTQDYSIYTWQAHTHSNTTQDTETHVSIDWSALQSPQKAAPTLTVALDQKPSPDRRGQLSVKLAGPTGQPKPTGQVTAKLIKNGEAVRTLTKTVSAGKATLNLPKAGTGSWKAIVKYRGSDTYLGARKTLTYRVN